MTILAIAATVAAYLGVYAAIAGGPALLLGLPSQIVFVTPGVLLVRAVARDSGWLPAVTLGPFVGQALGSLALTLLWIIGARGPWLLLAAPAIVGLLIPPARHAVGRWRLPATAPDDAIALPLLLLLVPLIVGLPFAHVGEIGPDGIDYRAYFTADYVWRRAVVIELAKGAALPVNPYFAGDALHYYWMPHVLTAVQYRFASAWASLDELLLIRSVSIDAVLVAFLYGMVRAFSVPPRPAAAGVAFAVVASSFEGLYALIDFARHGAPLAAVRSLNIDAVSRWYFQGIPIDGLQRLLFYQPHHAVGYGVGFIGLLALALRARARDAVAFAVAGVCLGLSVAISSFAGAMLTVAAAIFEAVAVLRARDWRRAVVHALAAAVPLAAAAELSFALRYVDTSGAVIEFGLNRLATRDFVWVTFLSFGPILIATAAALPLVWRADRGLGIFAALLASCVIFYFFINVRDHQDVYVGWRVGHFLFMAAAVPIGILIERIGGLPVGSRRVAWAGMTVLVLAGLPTTVIDVYNTQDITNFGDAPAGKWTLRLTPDDRQVFDWFTHNTSADAIVQVDPLPRDPEYWAYVPAFVERRMAAGIPISMVPLSKYQHASAEIRAIYDEPPLFAYERAIKEGIDYLIVGPPERAAHEGVEQRFDSVPDLLPLAFENGTISVYQVRQPR